MVLFILRWFGAYGDLYLAKVCEECASLDDVAENLGKSDQRGCCDHCGAGGEED